MGTRLGLIAHSCTVAHCSNEARSCTHNSNLLSPPGVKERKQVNKRTSAVRQATKRTPSFFCGMRKNTFHRSKFFSRSLEERKKDRVCSVACSRSPPCSERDKLIADQSSPPENKPTKSKHWNGAALFFFNQKSLRREKKHKLFGLVLSSSFKSCSPSCSLRQANYQPIFSATKNYKVKALRWDSHLLQSHNRVG